MNSRLKGQEYEELFSAVLALENLDECFDFFDDLCTVQELISIAQRFQVAKMLRAKKVYSEIVKETGASTATISRVNRALQYGCGGYDIVINRLDKKDE